MRQLTFVKPGLLEWWDVPEPRLQSPEEAIVRPLAVARCDLDVAIIAGKAPVAGPFPFGHEFVAEVVSLGEAVTGFYPGQRAVVPYHISCGRCQRCRRGLTARCSTAPPRAMYGLGDLGGEWGGALSELVRVPFAEGMLVPVPDGVEPDAIASVGDNVSDGWRTVAPYLEEWPGASVLVVGGGARSIGMYAAAIASALGASRVDYVDTDVERLDMARVSGANPIAGRPPDRLGPYPITVDASADRAGLACALRSVEPGGVCTSVGIYFANRIPFPLLDMYDGDVTFKTGRAHARVFIPRVLDLVRDGRLRPERITTHMAAWDDATEALSDPSTKVVISRA